MIVTRPKLTTAIVLGCLAVTSTMAAADGDIHEYRESVMKAVGGHTSAIAAIVKNEVPFTDDFKAHVAALNDLAPMTDHIFPEGSAGDHGDALPAIWERPEDFRKAVEAFKEAAADLSAVADQGPKAATPAFGALVKTCKGCHDDFRKKS